MLTEDDELEIFKHTRAINEIITANRERRARETSDQEFGIIADWVFEPIRPAPHIDNRITENKLETASLEFTEQEILKMPKQFRKEFRVDGCTARITQRKSGKKGYCYEIRYRRNGYNVTASSANLQTAKDKFLIALQNAIKVTVTVEVKIPTGFHLFSMYFFENFHIKKVAECTYKKHLRQYSTYILPALGKFDIKKITPLQCDKIFSDILAEGHGRLCEEVRSVLNQILDAAVAHELISRNPIKLLIYDKHERKSGKAISKADENILMSKLENEYLLPIAFLLYAGLRANELYTVRVDGEFVVANNSKRKRNQKKEIKRIAISPMLRPYLDKKFNTELFPKSSVLRDKLQKILPSHTLKDCRTTFSTRCQECGVERDVIKIFMGHALTDVLGQHYTDLSDEYFISEANKINY